MTGPPNEKKERLRIALAGANYRALIKKHWPNITVSMDAEQGTTRLNCVTEDALNTLVTDGFKKLSREVDQVLGFPIWKLKNKEGLIVSLHKETPKNCSLHFDCYDYVDMSRYSS
jgi:hypothetical protein